MRTGFQSIPKKHKYHLNKRQSYHTSFDVAEKTEIEIKHPNPV
jgi:hypothetical protein